jgi:hypothetical protein
VKRLTPWLLVAIALAGCAKSTSRPSAKMKGPTGVALFRGYAADAPGTLRQLVAVSNTRGDDLRVIDAMTNQVLLGPTLVAALTIPTESRPTLIAAGRLDDLDGTGTGVAALPDLLVVAPRGLVARPSQPDQFAAAIQVVVTWDPAMRVDRTIDLGDVAPDAIITALAVIPEARPDGTRLPGTARVVIGLSDGGLLTIQATRAVGSEAIVLGDPSRLDLGITRQDLAFTPLDLASPPYDLAFPAPDPAPVPGWNRLYLATTDPIPGPGGVLGVAELDVTGTPGAWPVRAISGRIGTTRVAAAGVAPFIDNDPDATIPDFDQFGPVVPRVYAAVDLSACGRDRSMPCGVAVIDPVAGGLAADPAGELPYQLPFQVDGEVVSLAVSGPPQESDRPGYLQLAPASGRRWTQSMGAISSSVGRIYIADLSHFALANDVSSLVGNTRTRVTSAASLVPSLTSNTIGLWQWLIPKDPEVTWPLYIDTFAVFGVGVTPGYTPNDDWFVTYQGVMPGLGSRLAVARVPAGPLQPPTQVALQQATELTGPGTSPWRSVVRVYDPRLAIQPFDIVEVSGFETGVCPLGKFEMVVTGLLPPTADAPGGAIALAPAGSQPTNDGQTLPANPSCLPAGDSPVTVTVRAWGYVLLGSRTGYGGRPQEIHDPRDGTPAFELRYEDEDLLSCPIMPDRPDDWPPAAADVAACEADVVGCRATCERLALARRARRLFYVTSRCANNHEQACYNTWVELAPFVNGDPQPLQLPLPLAFPLPTGPVVAFKLGVQRDEGGFDPPERGAYLTFSTGSGYAPSARVPYNGTAVTGAVMPGRVLLYDRTETTGLTTDGIHGFAAFVDNLVLEFASGSAAQNSTTIR